jgi:hypothetical protein
MQADYCRFMWQLVHLLGEAVATGTTRKAAKREPTSSPGGGDAGGGAGAGAPQRSCQLAALTSRRGCAAAPTGPGTPTSAALARPALHLAADARLPHPSASLHRRCLPGAPLPIALVPQERPGGRDGGSCRALPGLHPAGEAPLWNTLELWMPSSCVCVCVCCECSL